MKKVEISFETIAPFIPQLKVGILRDANIDELADPFDINKWESGYYSVITGNQSSSSDHKRSLKMMVKPGASYLFGPGTRTTHVLAWDVNGDFVGSLGQKGSSEKTYLIPITAKYIAFYTGAETDISTWTFKEIALSE